MTKPFINVPGIKNSFLRRLWIIPLGVGMIGLAISLTVFALFVEISKAIFNELVDGLDLALSMAADIWSMVKTVWKGEQNG
jgi:hypothetical protein